MQTAGYLGPKASRPHHRPPQRGRFLGRAKVGGRGACLLFRRRPPSWETMNTAQYTTPGDTGRVRWYSRKRCDLKYTRAALPIATVPLRHGGRPSPGCLSVQPVYARIWPGMETEVGGQRGSAANRSAVALYSVAPILARLLWWSRGCSGRTLDRWRDVGDALPLGAGGVGGRRIKAGMLSSARGGANGHLNRANSSTITCVTVWPGGNGTTPVVWRPLRMNHYYPWLRWQGQAAIRDANFRPVEAHREARISNGLWEAVGGQEQEEEVGTTGTGRK